MQLQEHFLAFVQRHQLVSGEAPTLLAFSGGLDSTVMAHLFKWAGFPCALAHCNFQLRGAESDEDARFAEALARDRDLPFYIQTFDTQAYAQANGLSIQVAARALRYHWFEQLCAEEGFARVATAHHSNDSAETILLNLVRGAGLSGLGGIPLQNGRIVRPLLFAARTDLEAYAHAHGLAWREDSSNAKDDYARNFVRHQVVPLLQTLNPALTGTLAHHAALLRDTAANYDFLLRQYADWRPCPEGLCLDKAKISQLPAPAQALFEYLRPYGFTPEQARQLADKLEEPGFILTAEPSDAQKLAARVLVDRSRILLEHSGTADVPQEVLLQEDDLMLRLPGGGTLFHMPASTEPPYPDGREAIVVDRDLLQFPLRLRPWQPGDRFQPIGMEGSKKLQDFFTDLKLSRFEKQKMLVLENGDGRIIWVLGHRADGRFKITTTTQQAALLRLQIPE